MIENEWVYKEYSTVKNCCGGFIKASIMWRITGKSGYELHINKVIFKRCFETMDAAKIVADKFIHKRIMEYMETVKQEGDE